MTPVNHEQRVAALERRTRLLQRCIYIQIVLLCAIVAITCRGTREVHAASPETLKVRGLIIADEQGRARILIGAPFPKVPERVRTDASTQAIVFLDENGHDRLTLGAAPDPQVGGKVLHRIAPSFGVLIHDANGDERGSYGWLANGRALITLDRPGAEAWATVVNDRTGETATSFNFPPEIAGDTQALSLGTKGPQTFLRFANLKGSETAAFSTSRGASPLFRVAGQGGSYNEERFSSAGHGLR